MADMSELSKHEEPEVEFMSIPHSTETELDVIDLYFRNVDTGKGYVTITCWGSAWTCWFGGMGGNTIQEFFAKANVGYLINKLGLTPQLKQTKREHAYLRRIIIAVQEALKTAASPEAEQKEK